MNENASTSPILLQKVIFPASSDPDVVPLYVDPDEWTHIVRYEKPDPEMTKHRRGVIADDTQVTPLRMTQHNAIPMIDGRRGLVPGQGKRVSLATYFNAFPASYWRRWTTLSGVRLSVSSKGSGDVLVYRSNARGVIQMVDSKSLEGEKTTIFDLGFDYFIDGGWYWFDVISRSDDFAMTNAEWQAPPDTKAPKTTSALTIAVTTLNRVSYCLDLLHTISGDPDALDGLSQIVVVDQGTEKIRESERFTEVEEELAGKLRVIEQVNAGGSGGFSRGMIETLGDVSSDFVMLLDDDVVVEPESIRRTLVFGSLCTSPTIVGGHMFDMFDKTKLHAFGEGIDTWNFMWGPVTAGRHDFAASSLRETGWLHQRLDVVYNGWWMSLIPTVIIREIGLSLPVFIKWDDAEYSLRARKHGYNTVSLPGAAVWHVSWVDKDDSRDWQAFYHARNRLISALLYSPHPNGGRLPISNLAVDVRHLLTMDYYTVRLRQLAYASVLAGPGSLHRELTTRLPSIRALSKKYRESSLIKDLSSFERFPPTTTDAGTPRPSGVSMYVFLVRTFIRHGINKPAPNSSAHPDVHLPRSTPWWVVPNFDNVAITNAEGSGVTWHQRDRRQFRILLWSALTKNLRYRIQWKSLAKAYREQLEDITSETSWRSTLGLGPTPDGGGK